MLVKLATLVRARISLILSDGQTKGQIDRQRDRPAKNGQNSFPITDAASSVFEVSPLVPMRLSPNEIFQLDLNGF